MAHEKGEVKGEIGRFRRRHLVLVPAVVSLAALNQLASEAKSLDDAQADDTGTGQGLREGVSQAEQPDRELIEQWAEHVRTYSKRNPPRFFAD
jgi:hypothetical protein